MSYDERPLHVRVAEAIGAAVDCRFANNVSTKQPDGSWRDEPLGWTYKSMGATYHVKRYDTDWSATGPLIERFEIAVRDTIDADSKPGWIARRGGWPDDGSTFGRTPLVAVCNLILALHAAGKLPK